MGVNLFNNVWGDNDETWGDNRDAGEDGNDDVAAVATVLGASTAISCSNSECKCSCKDRPRRGSRLLRFVSADVDATNAAPAGANDATTVG